MSTILRHALTWVALAGLTVQGLSAAGADRRLIDAVREGDGPSVQSLLKRGADVNATLGDGSTALHWAANAENVALTRALLAAGAKVDTATDYGVTPLGIAVAGRNTEVVEALLAAGANPGQALPTGETVLMTAARSGALGAVQALIAKGADVNAHESVMGQTALMWAIAEDHADVARALVDAGAEVTARSSGDFTALLFAVREGRAELVRLLLDKGANVNDTDKTGHSALHVAVLRGYPGIATDLLNRGADPNASGCGYTALHWVAGVFETIHTHDYIFNQTAVSRVQEWSALAGITDREAKHALITALLAKGADVNAKATKPVPRFGFTLFKSNLIVGSTPFLVASLSADAPTMQLLLDHGADPFAKNNDGHTALTLASGAGRVEGESRISEEDTVAAVKLLLARGLKPNEQNKYGMAAMHFAAMWELHKVIPLLLEQGADINIKNAKGETPMKLAIAFEDNVIVFMRPETAAFLKTLGGTE